MPNLRFPDIKVRYVLAALIVAFLLIWPRHLFNVPYSTVVTNANGQLLSAHIANDGQWRFPRPDSVPKRFETCLLMFEDEYFYHHPGVNPVSAIRALWQNISTQSVVSGGSTLTMQTVRMAKQYPRTLWAKLWETVLAVRLECRYSKPNILALYAAHAPFGGNVVGLEAASWRYFGVPAHQLSWAECATLAVLPNSPSLVHTGRNRHLLKAKRDRLLKKLMENGVIDDMELQLSIDEPVVPSPTHLPQNAPHLLDYYLKSAPGTINKTSIISEIQEHANQTVSRHGRMLAQNQIFNAAAIVVNNRTAKVVAYVGNTPSYQGQEHQNHVDIIRSERSTGSILKPFLYAAALQDGLITPTSLMPDVPTFYSDFSPQNYQRSFDGAVKANEALSRSLNIPAVRLLDEYGCDRFLALLRNAGFETFNKPADHYGLSLILGGGETCLWDLANAYSSMARVLNNYEANGFGYSAMDTEPISLSTDTIATTSKTTQKYPKVFSASSVWFTLEALTQVQRPPEEDGWEAFAGARRIAWKTGTSFGYRDAWAVGITPDFTVAVWVGNASGEGRPGIMGGTAAAPIMFDIFRMLPPSSWFTEPFEDMALTRICRQSGFVASHLCDDADTLYLPAISAPYPMCPYHKRIHLDAKGMYRVTEACCPVEQMVHQNRFVLPPLMESYYKFKHPFYEPLPPFQTGCNDDNERPMEFIYPQPGMALFVPKNLDGNTERVVLRAAHRNPSARLFWHIDDLYVGETQTFHNMEVLFNPGWHTITVVDDQGFKMARRIQCVNK